MSVQESKSQQSSQSAIIQKDTLATFLEGVDPLVDEAKVHLNEDGLQIKAVDPANVGMVDTTLSAETGSSGFEAYHFSGGTIGVNIGRLQDMISIADAGDLVHLSLNEETRKLHIEIGGFEGTMALIDPDSIRQEPDLPDLELTAEVIFEGRWLSKAAKAADMVSDHVAFGAVPDTRTFYMDAEGDTDDVHWELSDEELIDGSTVDDDAHSLFSLDYVKDMTKPLPKDAEVTFEIGEEFPFDCRFELCEGAVDVRYMLAPRIQSE